MLPKEREIVVLQHTLKCLCYLNIWPAKGTEFNPGKFFYFKYIAFSASACSLLCANIYQLITGGGEGFAHLDTDIANFLSCLSYYYYCSGFVRNAPKLAAAYAELSDFESFGKPYTFDKDNGRLHNTSKYVSLALLFIPLNSSISTHQIYIHTRFLEMASGLIFGANIELGGPNGKMIVFVFSLYVNVLTLMAACFVAFALTESIKQLEIRWKHVKACFIEAFSERGCDTRRKLLGKCIEYHVRMFELSQTMNKLFEPQFYAQFLLTSCIAGCCMHSIIQANNNTEILNSVNLLTSWVVVLFMQCVYGQSLIEHSISIRDAIFQTEWDDLDIDTKKDLIMVASRCVKPVCLSAKPFGILSHNTIVQILKASYSWLALITSIN